MNALPLGRQTLGTIATPSLVVAILAGCGGPHIAPTGGVITGAASAIHGKSWMLPEANRNTRAHAREPHTRFSCRVLKSRSIARTSVSAKYGPHKCIGKAWPAFTARRLVDLDVGALFSALGRRSVGLSKPLRIRAAKLLALLRMLGFGPAKACGRSA
jgi:hypothetical protein